MKRFQTLALVLPLQLAVPATGAEGPLGSADSLLCAAHKVLLCEPSAPCSEVEPAEVELPRFVLVDLKAKQISAVWPAEPERTSRVETLRMHTDRILLQGVDDDIPWAATIDKANGDLVVSQSRPASSSTVFGACMPR